MKDENLQKLFDGLPPRRSDRNKAILTMEQIMAIKTARANGKTPKQIEDLIGISVFKIHKIINMKTALVKEEVVEEEVVEIETPEKTLDTLACVVGEDSAE